MSLNAIRGKQTAVKRHIRKGARIVLPPEYEITLDVWREYIAAFNRTERSVRLATMFVHFIKNREPEFTAFDTLLTVDKIVEKDGEFFADLYFVSNRAGLTAIVLYEGEKLCLVPVCNPKDNYGITHLSLVYTPPI